MNSDTSKLLLCTDMDRTIIPNGRQAEHPEARKWFHRLCELPEVNLVYVTGRHLQLVTEAIADYNLPEPGYIISDVGTKIYRPAGRKWHEVVPWQEKIARDWQGKTHAELQQALAAVAGLSLQEKSKQSDFKLSYYLPLDADQEAMPGDVEHILAGLDVAASLIWSIDETAQTGLLDILPQHATKLHGIEFLHHYLGYDRQDIIFAGDSGNDLAVLGSSIRSILVANAEPKIQQQAKQLTARNGCEETLYLARQHGFTLGGNYAAGVVQGVLFFYPELGEKLKIS